MFGPGVIPGNFVLVCKSEHPISNAQVVLGAFAQTQQAIAILFFHPISSKDSVLVVTVYPHHIIEVTLNDEFAAGRGYVNNLVQILAESCHIYIWTHEIWYIQ